MSLRGWMWNQNGLARRRKRSYSGLGSWRENSADPCIIFTYLIWLSNKARSSRYNGKSAYIRSNDRLPMLTQSQFIKATIMFCKQNRAGKFFANDLIILLAVTIHSQYLLSSMRSVTRRQYIYLIICHWQQWKFAQYHNKFARLGLNLPKF